MYLSDRLYVINNIELSAPYPRIGAAAPLNKLVNFLTGASVVVSGDETKCLLPACSSVFHMSSLLPMQIPIAPEAYEAQKSADIVTREGSARRLYYLEQEASYRMAEFVAALSRDLAPDNKSIRTRHATR